MSLKTILKKLGLIQPSAAERQRFIEQYVFPAELETMFARKRPELSRDERAVVWKALRQYFVLHNHGNKHKIAMPSLVVSEVWYAFTLLKSDYEEFCHDAFGSYLPYSAANADAEHYLRDDSLTRLWRLSCEAHGINALQPASLPLLFAIDELLKINNGLAYKPDDMAALHQYWQEEWNRQRTAALQAAQANSAASHARRRRVYHNATTTHAAHHAAAAGAAHHAAASHHAAHHAAAHHAAAAHSAHIGATGHVGGHVGGHHG